MVRWPYGQIWPIRPFMAIWPSDHMRPIWASEVSLERAITIENFKWPVMDRLWVYNAEIFLWPLDTHSHQWFEERSKIQKKCIFGTPYYVGHFYTFSITNTAMTPFHFSWVGVDSGLNIQLFKWRWCWPTWFVLLQSSGKAFLSFSQFWLFWRLFLFGGWFCIHRCEVGGSVEACWDGGGKGLGSIVKGILPVG